MQKLRIRLLIFSCLCIVATALPITFCINFCRTTDFVIKSARTIGGEVATRPILGDGWPIYFRNLFAFECLEELNLAYYPTLAELFAACSTEHELSFEGKKLDLSTFPMIDAARLGTIRRLRLDYSGASNDAIRAFASSRNLELVGASGTLLENSGVESLSRCQDLYHLRCASTLIDDGCVEMMLKMKKLRRIDVSDTRVSRRSIKRLCELPQLEDLRVARLGLSSDELSDLQRQFPHLFIWDY